MSQHNQHPTTQQPVKDVITVGCCRPRMSNLSGYCDYYGPNWLTTGSANQEGTPSVKRTSQRDTCWPSSSDTFAIDYDTNPLQVGFWMEGDSLAPPCGCTIATVHALLELARVSADDIIYDLGCGDGRICLEACAKVRCRSVGVEVEEDLVKRARDLIAAYCDKTELNLYRPRILHKDLRDVIEMLLSQIEKGQTNSAFGEPDRNLLSPTVIVLFLLPEAIAEIEDSLVTLLRIIPSLRIVCNTWGLRAIRPDETQEVFESNGAMTTLYLYSANSLRVGMLNE
jgi:Histone methylation protein DOT1